MGTLRKHSLVTISPFDPIICGKPVGHCSAAEEVCHIYETEGKKRSKDESALNRKVLNLVCVPLIHPMFRYDGFLY